MALDPGAFAPSFEGRMSTFMQELRQMEPVSYSLVCETHWVMTVSHDIERLWNASIGSW